MDTLRCALFIHSGSSNRGCEAIVRATCAEISQVIQPVEIFLLSNDPQTDTRFGVGELAQVFPASRIKRPSLPWLLSGIKSHVFHDPIGAMAVRHRQDLSLVSQADIAFSIGGDNYCYGPPNRFYAIDQAIKSANKWLVFWGCSIDPEDVLHNTEVQRDLALFDLITPRESITYGVLLESGVNSHVYLHADPAFAMNPEPVALPFNWEAGNMIGLNLSPLILRYQNKSGDLTDHAGSLVSHILKTTESKIALIPHVTQPDNNDWQVLNMLYEQFEDTGRLIQLGQNLNSPQTKYIISQCRMFIGARTHSTIAAYSTGVPALALGYSIKARGIARDIFGGEEGLVLPVQELVNEKQLINAFEGLREREDELRSYLTAFMPDYIQSARNAGLRVAELLNS